MDLTSILPALGGTAWTLIFFIIALSVIVAIHEYGHYIVGRWCGIHAEVFSIGFGKVLFTRQDRRGTRWQIAALPFGGYVKFLGDANAASVGGTAEVPDVSPRNTMLGAPLWARAATVAAGPIFNFILAIFIFAGYMMWEGETTDPLTYGGSPELPPGFVSELQLGDQIVAVDGFSIEELGNVLQNSDLLTVKQVMDWTVLRDGEETTVKGPYPILPLVATVSPRSAADDAGIRVGDFITHVNGQEIYSLRDIIRIKGETDNAPLTLTVYRDGESFDSEMTPRRVDIPRAEGGFETRYLVGLVAELYFAPEVTGVGPFDALWSGTQELWWRITTSLSGLWHMITGAISSCNLSGPVGIAQTSGSMAQQGAESFVLFIGILSVAVGLLNLFPIPILDGGHLVFHAYEAVTRRKPSDAALRVLMSLGVAIIGSTM
ncbi:MAG: RIP metalloprotease RseP, partial [Pseudomonadota bacterium]